MQTAGIQKGRPEDIAWAEAFTQVIRYCAENDEQITITDLCEEVKGVLRWRHAIHREIHENEAQEPFQGGRHPYWYLGGNRMLLHPSQLPKISWNDFKNLPKKKTGGGGGGGGGWSVQIAAKLLPVNINNIETSKEYASGAKVTDLAANLDYILPSLLVFVVVAVAGEERTWSQNSFSG